MIDVNKVKEVKELQKENILMIENNTLKDILLKILVNGGEPRKNFLSALDGLLITKQRQEKVWRDEKEFNKTFFKSQEYFDSLKDEDINTISNIIYKELFKEV